MVTRTKRPVRERRHRLPRDAYAGEVVVSFTTCVAGRKGLFSDLETVGLFATDLRSAAARHTCAVLVYCFMPDHLHVVLQGANPGADLWSAIVLFKQKTGYWLKRYRPGTRWQKDFHDRFVRRDENLIDHIRYIVNNPVRAGLVRDWREYPGLGSDVLRLEDV